MKKILLLLSLCFALTTSLFGLFACGGNPSGENPGEHVEPEKKYTVSFINTTLQNQEVVEGTTFACPVNPTKQDNIFEGWYSDASFDNKVSFPITINADTKIYAKFVDYLTAFNEAKEKTVGENVSKYEYDYTLSVSAAYGTVSLKGNSVGNTKYSKDGEINFYDSQTLSGALFNDGSKYQIKKGDTLQEITTDENDAVVKCKTEKIDQAFKFNSSFAKAIFEYGQDAIKKVKSTNVKDEYKLETSFNASKGISLVGNYLNSTIVEKLIGKLPETDVNTGMTVKFTLGGLSSYTYTMNINVASISFSLEYKLNFKTPSSQNIVPRTFAGIYISDTEINNAKTEIANSIKAYKEQEKSAYDFEFKSGIDYGVNEWEINSKVSGSTKRKIVEGEVFYHNDIDISTDFENADLYKSKDVSNIHIKRAQLANGETWNVEKKLFDDLTQLENYTATQSDKFYLLEVLEKIGTPSFIKKEVKSDTRTVYTLGIGDSEIVELIKWLNGEINIDPLDRASVDVKVFGSINENSLVAKTANVVFTIDNGVLSSAVIKSKGKVETYFSQSRDFTASDLATYKLELTITATDDANSYEPYTDKKDVK